MVLGCFLSLAVMGYKTRYNSAMATLAYQEIVSLIADANSSSVVSFRPSEGSKRRVTELLEKERTQALSDDERRELEQYMQLERVMRLAKAKARQLLDELS